MPRGQDVSEVVSIVQDSSDESRDVPLVRVYDLQRVLIGATALWDLANIYLAYRNVLAVRRNENAEYAHLEDVEYETSLFVIIHSVADFILKTVKLYGGFYSAIWDMTSLATSVFGLSQMTSRAVYYMLIVNTIQGVEDLIIGLLTVVLVTPRVHKQTEAARLILFSVIQFPYESFLSLLQITSCDHFSKESILKVVLVWRFFYLLCHEPMQYLGRRAPDMEVPEYLIRNADAAGFPEKRIRMSGSRQEPRAKYFKVCFVDYIVVNSALLRALDGAQASAIFSRELGHWKHCHIYAHYFFTALELVLGDMLLYFAVNHDETARFFGLDPRAHLIVKVTLAAYFVNSTVRKFVRCIGRVVNARLELQADDFYAHQVEVARSGSALITRSTKPSNLHEALRRLAQVDPDNYQFFDDWFSAIFHGQPTMSTRLRRLEKKARFSERE